MFAPSQPIKQAQSTKQAQPVKWVFILLISTISLTMADRAYSANGFSSYHDCITAVQAAPLKAFERSVSWEEMGGGHPAKHCTAQALLALGQPAAAARRLQTLAQQTASVAPRAAILAEAGLAWAEATLWDRALNLQLQAMKLDPSNLEIAIDTAITYAALDQDIEAVKVLNSVLVANPKRTDALVLRGSAYRRLGAIQYALDDLNLSLKRDPNHLDALLERGLLWQTLHNAIAARRDWLHLITSDPESVQAEWAQQHLQRMDNTLEDLNMDQDTSLPHAPVVLQPPTSPATDAKKPIVLKKPQ